MPQTFGTRRERRSFSRKAARHFATTRLRQPEARVSNEASAEAKPLLTRAERRRNGWRGDISALVHGKHDTAWLYSGTLNASGQQRINHKRNQRAAYWHTVRIRVSAEMEPYFRASLHLLGAGTRIDGRTELTAPHWFTVDLHVHIPGAPADAVTAEPIYRNEHNGDGTYTPMLDHIVWHRANGSPIETR